MKARKRPTFPTRLRCEALKNEQNGETLEKTMIHACLSSDQRFYPMKGRASCRSLAKPCCAAKEKGSTRPQKIELRSPPVAGSMPGELAEDRLRAYFTKLREEDGRSVLCPIHGASLVCPVLLLNRGFRDVLDFRNRPVASVPSVGATSRRRRQTRRVWRQRIDVTLTL
jgi:hypothetical protein